VHIIYIKVKKQKCGTVVPVLDEGLKCNVSETQFLRSGMREHNPAG
jgi:hypothetical protein